TWRSRLQRARNRADLCPARALRRRRSRTQRAARLTGGTFRDAAYLAPSRVEQSSHRSAESVRKKRHGEQIGAAAGTEVAGHEHLMDPQRLAAPSRLADTARREKGTGYALCEREPVESSPMEQIRIAHRRDQSQTRLHARGFRIPSCEPAPDRKGGNSDTVDRRKAERRLLPGASSPIAPSGPRAVALRYRRHARNGSSP